MALRRLLRRALVPALLTIAGGLLPAAAHAEPGPTELRLSAPITVDVGDAVELHATLTAGGEPVDGAVVVLYERAGFMNVGAREVAVASVSTDEGGVAVIKFVARREGARQLTVRYEGSEEHAPADVAIELTVAAGAQTYIVDAQPGIPGVNRFLVMTVLAGVWGTMLVVALHVVAIAREGAAEAEREARA
jgi:hypothetical protein